MDEAIDTKEALEVFGLEETDVRIGEWYRGKREAYHLPLELDENSPLR